ncbi:unnamed protein product, partial [Mesorhabditis spiculigera]
MFKATFHLYVEIWFVRFIALWSVSEYNSQTPISKEWIALKRKVLDAVSRAEDEDVVDGQEEAVEAETVVPEEAFEETAEVIKDVGDGGRTFGKDHKDGGNKAAHPKDNSCRRINGSRIKARNATYHVTDDLEYPEVYVEPTPQQSQRNRGNGIWNFTTICTIVALICFPVVSGLTAVNCLKTANPRLINLPDLSDCSLSHQGVRWTAKVYERNENFKKVPSFHCSVEQVRACRRAYLGIFESGEATPSVPDEISAEQCRHAVEKGTIENRKLIGRSQHFWSTDQDDSPTTPWWGERCVEVRRFEVTEGEAYRGQDEIILTITPGLAPLDKNEIRLYNGITVWGDLSETKCDYKFIKLADVLTDYSRVYLQELGWIDGLTSEEPVKKCEQIGYETSGGLFIVRENGKQKREAPPNGKAIALPQIAFEYNPLLDPEFDLKNQSAILIRMQKALHRIGNQVEQVNGSTFYRISRAWQQIEAWNKTWIEKGMDLAGAKIDSMRLELADFYNYQKNQNVVGRLRELERKVEDARIQANTPAPETITTTISSKLASEEATRAKTLRDIIQRLEKLEAKEDPIPPNTAGLELKLKEMMKRLQDQKTVDDNLKELIQELREQLDLLATPEPQASIHDPFEVECNRQAEELRYWKLQLAVNPTYASRKLLGKANLLAQMIDENRFIVSECQTIELTESMVIKTQRVEERCFAEVPIKHEGEIKFLKVPEMDIVPNGTEISCRGMRIAPAVLYMDFKANNAKKPLGNSNLGKRMARQSLSDGPRKWVNTPIQWMKDIQSKYRQTTDGAGDLIDEVKNYTRTVADKAKDTAGQAMEKGKVVLKDALAEVKSWALKIVLWVGIPLLVVLAFVAFAVFYFKIYLIQTSTKSLTGIVRSILPQHTNALSADELQTMPLDQISAVISREPEVKIEPKAWQPHGNVWLPPSQ